MMDGNPRRAAGIALRENTPPIQFGSDETREAHESRLQAARKAQVVEYAVAPGALVVGRNGRIYHEGEEITLADLEGADVHPPARLERLLRHHVVLDRADR